MNPGPILTVASILLAIYYVFYADAPLWGRVAIAVMVAGSLVLPPSLMVVKVVLQLGAALFVLLRLQLDM